MRAWYLGAPAPMPPTSKAAIERVMATVTSEYLRRVSSAETLAADLARALTFQDMRRVLDGCAGLLRYSDAFL